MTDAADWRGAVGAIWAAEWERTDRAFAAIAVALDRAVLAAAPAGPFRALDIGSGAGATSLALTAARPDATITGVDLSTELVAVARERAARRAGPAGPRFVAGDVVGTAAATAQAPFDLMMSRHGVMFFADPVAALGQLRGAARPGAPLVFSCFADRAANPWAGAAAEVVAGRPLPAPGDTPGPFAFADRDRVAAILADAGWRGADARPLATMFRVGAGADPVADALHFLSRIGSTAGLLRALSTDARAEAMPGSRPSPPATDGAMPSTSRPRHGYGRRRHKEAAHDHHRPPSRKLAVAAGPVAARGARPAL